MARNARTPISSARISAFKSAYPLLEEALATYSMWLSGPRGPDLAQSTAAAYPSTLRGVFTRVLIERMPPSEAIRLAGSAAVGAALRAFLALATNGGFITWGPTEDMQIPRFDASLPPGFRELIQARVQTPLGDLLHAGGLTRCVRALWPAQLPDEVAMTPLRLVLTQEGALHRLTRSLLDAGPCIEVRALVRMALFSHAGGPLLMGAAGPSNYEVALNTAWPFDPEAKKNPGPVQPYAFWDLAGRLCLPDVDLPPEGEALMRGEAIDLAGVAPLTDVSPATFRRLSGPRYAGVPKPTVEEAVRERARLMALFGEPLTVTDVEAYHGPAGRAVADAACHGAEAWLAVESRSLTGAPTSYRLIEAQQPAAATPAWALIVNVAGVPALGDSHGDVGSLPPPTPTEPEVVDQSSRTVSEEEGLRSVEVPLTAGEDAFDAPEVPS